MLCMRGAGTTSYGINGLGERTVKSGSAVPTGASEFVYDEESRLIGEYDKDGAVVEETAYLGDTPIAVLKGTGTSAAVYTINANNIDAPQIMSSGRVRTV